MRIFHLTGETLVLRDSPDTLRILGAFLALGGVAPIVEALRNQSAAAGMLALEHIVLLAAGVLGVLAGVALIALPRTTTCMVDRSAGTLRVTHQNALGTDGWGCYLSSLIDVLLEPKFGADGHTLYRITLVSSSGRRIALTSYSSAGVGAQMPAVAALRQFLPPTARRRATRASSLAARPDRAQWSRVARFLYLSAAGLIVLLGGGALIAWNAVREGDAYRTVSMTVLTTRVETKIGGDGTVRRRPVVVYRYMVDGRVYTSDRVTHDEGWRGGKWAFQVVNRFAPGQRSTAFYDPANPAVAFLVKPHDLARYALALVPLLGLLVVTRAIRGWMKRVPPKGPKPSQAAAAETGLVFIHA